MTRYLPLRLAPLLLAAACTTGATQEFRENQGAVCALSSQGRAWTEAQSFEEGAALQLQYFVDQCLSSSCDTERSATCTAVVEGNVIQVETRAQWQGPPSTGAACTTDCGLLTASCATPPLAAGEYTIRSGDHEVAITVPSEVNRASCTLEPLF